MAADCSDSPAAACLTMDRLTGSRRRARSPSISSPFLIGFLFDSFVAPVLAETPLSSLFFFSRIVPFFSISVGIPSFPLLYFSTRFLFFCKLLPT